MKEVRVGEMIPTKEPVKARFIEGGPLKDKTALVSFENFGVAYAQFDAIETDYGFGWHAFPAYCFALEGAE